MERVKEKNVDVERHRNPIALVGAVAVGAESALLMAAGAWIMWVGGGELLGQATATSGERSSAPIAVEVVSGLMAVLLGIGLAFAASASARGRWPLRGLVLTWQLIQAAAALQTIRNQAAMPMTEVARWAWGVPLFLLAVIAGFVWLRGGGDDARA